MLVAWSAAWADSPEASSLLSSFRTSTEAEPLLAAVWTLRVSTDELALERAQRSLEGTELGELVIALGLRDALFRKKLTWRTRPSAVSFSLWLSALMQGGQRAFVARGLGVLWGARAECAGPDGYVVVRVLDEPKRRALEVLLSDPREEIRGAVVCGLTDTWANEGVRAELRELLWPHLDDPIVGTATCRWLEDYLRHEPKGLALDAFRKRFSMTLVHRADFLRVFIALGEMKLVLTHFAELTRREKSSLLGDCRR